MLEQTPNISVIIPCFNEEGSIGKCLDALSRQTLKPLEIIVVDNNCTDATVEIAKKYDRVRIVKEERQGLVPSRDAGFAAARGKILARLDADSRPAPHWLAMVAQLFEDETVQAASGTGFFYDAPCKRLVRAYRNIFAVWFNRLIMGHHMLWGSNMALRTDAWHKVNHDCCHLANIMEDLDIAIHISKNFGKRSILYRPQMRVDISARRAMVTLGRNWLYLKMWPRTLALHRNQKKILLWPAIGILLALIAFGNKIARFYNATEGRMVFSLKQWRSNPLYNRINP